MIFSGIAETERDEPLDDPDPVTSNLLPVRRPHARWPAPRSAQRPLGLGRTTSRGSVEPPRASREAYTVRGTIAFVTSTNASIKQLAQCKGSQHRPDLSSTNPT